MTAATSPPRRRSGRRGDHPDAPDTAVAFRRLAQLPSGARRDALRERLVCRWLPMATRLARRYRDRGEESEDLEQVAALGLTKAVERYDPAQGHAFESYAIPVILGEIKRHFRDCTWDVHVPRRVQELRGRVRQSMRELDAGSSGAPPAVSAIAAHSGLSEEDVRLGMGALQSYASLSLDAELPAAEGGGGGGGGGGRTLLDTLGSTESAYQLTVRRETVRPSLRQLPQRERRMLYLRFYCEMTQSQIAAQLGISQMQVSRVLRATCERVRMEVECSSVAAEEPALGVPPRVGVSGKAGGRSGSCAEVVPGAPG